MGIHTYLAQTERTYSYRIKTVVPLKDNDDAMGRIERAIMKYQPVKMDQPRKLMFQAAPQDFPFLQNAEIFVLDIELDLPASPSVLTKEIASMLGISDKFLVVRGENDPIETQVQADTARAEMDEDAEKKGEEKGALLDLPEYEEVEAVEGGDLYGDGYNRRLLGYLKKVEAEKAPKVVDTANGGYDLLKSLKPDVAADAGPTIGSEDGDVAGEMEDRISKHGNIDDNRRSYTRAYKRKGGTYVASQKADPVRKD